jgi:soluble lytic murein transglycosylase-like protein
MSNIGFAESLDIIHNRYKKDQIINTLDTVDFAISKLIQMPTLQRKRLSVVIALASKEYQLDPRILLSILYVESNFKQSAKSNTGDFSIAQINFKVWEHSFKKMKKTPLNFKQLKEDETYAIYRMAEILNLLKNDHEKSDKFWFARYHSSTPKYKKRYIGMLQKPLKKLLPFGPNMLKMLPNNKNDIINIYLGS